MRTRPSTAPRPDRKSEHARAGWRQLLIAPAGANLAGLLASRSRSLLGSSMIGQKTLYSFFSPNASGKRRACSPEPEDLGTGVAAVVENGDVTVRRGGGRLWARGQGREGRAKRVRRVMRARRLAAPARLRSCRNVSLTG